MKQIPPSETRAVYSTKYTDEAENEIIRMVSCYLCLLNGTSYTSCHTESPTDTDLPTTSNTKCHVSKNTDGYFLLRRSEQYTRPSMPMRSRTISSEILSCVLGSTTTVLSVDQRLLSFCYSAMKYGYEKKNK